MAAEQWLDQSFPCVSAQRRNFDLDFPLDGVYAAYPLLLRLACSQLDKAGHDWNAGVSGTPDQ